MIGYSVALAMKAIREIKSPDWYKELKTGYRGQHYLHYCEFSLRPLLEKGIIGLERIEGL